MDTNFEIAAGSGSPPVKTPDLFIVPGDFDWLNSVKTMSGFSFIPAEEQWSTGQGILDFSKLRCYLTDRFVDCLKYVFAEFGTNPKGLIADRSARTYFDAVKKAACHLTPGQHQELIDHLGVQHAVLTSTSTADLIATLKWLASREVLAIDPQRFRQHLFLTTPATKEIAALTIPSSGVRHPSDPVKGAFNLAADNLIIKSVLKGYEAKVITLEEYLLVWVFRTIGARSNEILQIKVKDFVNRGQDGWWLDIPLSKGNRAPRETCLPRQLSDDYAKLFKKLIHDNHLLPNDPLFKLDYLCNTISAKSGISESVKSAKAGWYKEGILKGHAVDNRLKSTMSSIMGRLGLHNTIQGNISGHRFRKTSAGAVGAQAIQTGNTMAEALWQIKQFLGHADVKTAKKYYVSPAIRQQSADQVAEILFTPLIEDLIPTLGSTENLVAPEIDDSYEVMKLIDRTINQRPRGGCAGDQCSRLMPWGCYTCPYMRAYSDGPHRNYLERAIDLAKEFYHQEQFDLMHDMVVCVIAISRLIWLISQRSSEKNI